jgi:hypothetical protein
VQVVRHLGSVRLASPGTLFVGASSTQASASSQAFALPGSPAINDLCLIFVHNITTTPAAPAGFSAVGTYTTPTLSYPTAVYGGLLAGLSAITISNFDSGTSIVELAIYRGPLTAVLISSQEATGSSLTASGFTPNGASSGVIMWLMDHDNSTIGTPPAGFNVRTSITGSDWDIKPWDDDTVGAVAIWDGNDTTVLAGAVVDNLTSYNGSSLAWSGLDNTYPQIAYVIELRH